MAKFTYDSFLNRSTSHCPFVLLIGLLPSRLIDLFLVLMEGINWSEANAFSKYVSYIYKA